MTSDLVIIFQVYLISFGLQLIAWPWLFKFGKKLADYGWASGRVAVSLTTALIIWFLGHLKLPVNNDFGIATTLLVIVFLTWKVLGKEIKPAFKILRKIGGFVLVEEILFAAGLVIYAIVRGYQPDILGLEKFMDFGFIKSYLASPTLPANDMWWAGGAINYYSFGQFWAGVLIRIWGVGAGVGYNLMLAFILASTLSLAFSVVVNLFAEKELSRPKTTMAGLVGAALVTLGGNSQTIWYFLTKGTLTGYWYADATRFIHNTIHEFPGYSFVVSDLHGHVLSLPMVLIFILLLIAWQKERRRLTEIGLGILLGVMAMTNTWDSAIYGLLVVMLLALCFLSGQLKVRKIMATLMVIGVGAVITALPWLIGFKSISDGLAAVGERTPLWQLAVLWAIHMGVTVAALTVAVAGKNKNWLVLTLGLSAISLILLPEFIYVRDIYPSHPRANTMFKFTYQAFIMMGLLFGWLAGKVSNIRNKVLSAMVTGGLFLLFGGLLIFPYLAFSSYYGGFGSYRGLDGFSFLYRRFPDEVAIINYLDKNRDGKNMIEAVGDSYTETDFISAFSGTATVVGWRVHEWLWRGGYEAVGKRDEEVKRFYETVSDAERNEIIKKYNLGWVVVSAREKEKYKIDERKIRSLGEVVLVGKSAYLIKLSLRTK
ncbi:MAG TPA: DUF2298 domain-containing protein [Patescibacteria group bacterium]|nr:DUF2298 domain-containing protein [Patescibacteria group bacterium]